MTLALHLRYSQPTRTRPCTHLVMDTTSRTLCGKDARDYVRAPAGLPHEAAGCQRCTEAKSRLSTAADLATVLSPAQFLALRKIAARGGMIHRWRSGDWSPSPEPGSRKAKAYKATSANPYYFVNRATARALEQRGVLERAMLSQDPEADSRQLTASAKQALAITDGATVVGEFTAEISIATIERYHPLTISALTPEDARVFALEQIAKGNVRPRDSVAASEPKITIRPRVKA